MCSVVATNGQHQTGSGGNGGAIVIDGGSDGTHTFCGATFTNNTGGMAALGGALFRTPDGAKQTTTIDRCTFDGNHGESGGAAYFHNSTLAIHASTFSNNIATKGSGALQADGTTFDLAQRHVHRQLRARAASAARCRCSAAAARSRSRRSRRTTPTAAIPTSAPRSAATRR